MKIFDMLVMCIRNLWRRKARTMLTVIGVVIGSCAVIVMISLGLGMSKAMDEMLDSFGNLNTVNIYSYSNDTNAVTDKVIDEIKAINHVSVVIPQLQLNNMVKLCAGKNDRYRSDVSITGVDLAYLKELGYYPEKGTVPEDEKRFRTIVFGEMMPYNFVDTKKKNKMIYKDILPDGSYTQPFFDPLSEKIKIGIINNKKKNEKGESSYGGKGYEYNVDVSAVLKADQYWESTYSVYVDLDFAKEILNNYNRLNSVKQKDINYSNVKVIVDNIDNVDNVYNTIKEMGLNASSMSEVRQQMKGQLGSIQMILGSLAAISLLVAAISITNTMIMSIYERTREIGIMKVLGCYISNIRMIFLMEAGGIGLLGGIIGAFISYIISIVINSLGTDVMSGFIGYSTGGGEISIIPLWLVLLALAFSTFIGIISGLYPANRAVKISALEAIKNE